MPDNIDAQQVVAARHSKTYKFCSRCGMLMAGVTCQFCKDLKREAPRKKDYWVGGARG